MLALLRHVDWLALLRWPVESLRVRIAHAVERVASLFVRVISVARGTGEAKNFVIVLYSFLVLLEDAHCVEYVQGVVDSSTQVLLLPSALLCRHLGRATQLLIARTTSIVNLTGFLRRTSS